MDGEEREGKRGGETVVQKTTDKTRTSKVREFAQD